MKGCTLQLFGLLRDWNYAERVPVKGDWVHQLSRWLGPADAISLSAAHQSIQATGLKPPLPRSNVKGPNLEEEFCRVRADLLKAMEPALPARPQDRRNRAPMKLVDVADGPEDPEPDYASYRQRYAEAQRRMDWRIDPLRSHCRQVLSQTNSQLRQLAELDATMEHLLGDRQKALLTKLPIILEKRFENQKRKHQASCQAGQVEQADQVDAPTLQHKPTQWATEFEKDFQSILRGEMEMRLESIAGLIEAFNEVQE